VFDEVIGISTVFIPMKEKVRVWLSGTIKENSPSVFVTVPEVVPFTDTETPGIGAPLSSVTFPEIFLVWANTDSMPKLRAIKSRK